MRKIKGYLNFINDHCEDLSEIISVCDLGGEPSLYETKLFLITTNGELFLYVHYSSEESIFCNDGTRTSGKSHHVYLYKYIDCHWVDFTNEFKNLEVFENEEKCNCT